MLSQAQRTIFERAQKLGSGASGVALDDAICRALIAVAATDFGVRERFSDITGDVPELFEANPPSSLSADGPDSFVLFERLIDEVGVDADTYFACLAALHKGRLKYQRILASQPVPTIDQVGPRALLQYGMLPPASLSSLLLWRKWMFDIDNRAGQESGYVFEPIVAHAIGGTPASATKSPVRRRGNESKGRQVDCLRGSNAYELKLRVTIAASGQGRWAEELGFPQDCRDSGFVPLLIVFDPTSNPKLTELIAAFRGAGGEAFVGDDAWAHLKEQAGVRMAAFLEKYVRKPLQAVLQSAPEALPELNMSMSADLVVFRVGGHVWQLGREGEDPDLVSPPDDEGTNDADDILSGS